MDFTAEVGKIYNVTPFEVLKQDKDEVIMLINYMVEKAEDWQQQNAESVSKKDNTKIKVNDKTATGGWW